MGKLLTLLLLIVSLSGYCQTEIQDKAHALALKYQLATNASIVKMQTAESALTAYFTYRSNGGTVSEALQNQVDAILNEISTGTSMALKSAQSASGAAITSGFTSNGTLNTGSKTYNRVMGASYNPSDLCATQGDLSGSGSNVYYNRHKLTVTTVGDVTIEVVEPTGLDDSYLFLYCSFDPLSPKQNLVVSNDDGGDGLLSKLTLPNLPEGTYDLVVTTFSNGDMGDYTVEVNSTGNVVLGPPLAVPVSYLWILGLFVVIAASVVVRKFL